MQNKTEILPNTKHQTDFTVRFTTNYSMFSHHKGNREVNPSHVYRIREAMKVRFLFSPIIVNEKKQIIDGQHRFEACKELGYPIYYVVVNGYGLEEIQMLNANTRNWTSQDYLTGYCDMKKPAYLQFKKFMEDFPDFGIEAAKAILLGQGNKDANREGKRVRMRHFENGTMVIANLERSYDHAKKLLDFKPHYEGFARRGFVLAMLRLFGHKNYKHREMMGKLAYQAGALRDCTNAETYTELIEHIYNYKRIEKVNLRY